MMDLKQQRESLSYDSNRVNTNLRLYELIRLFAQQDILWTKAREANELLDEESIPLPRWLLNKLLIRFVPVVQFLYVLSLFSKNKRAAMKLIIEARNNKAISEIDERLTKDDIVIIWRAGHLRGIEKWLKLNGFHEVRRKWFVAYKARDYSLLDSLKKIVGVDKKMTSVTTSFKQN